MANKNNEDIYCSFCGKPQEMAGRLIAGNGVYICDRCVELCMNILRESGELERENAELRQANEILKDALGFFAKDRKR